MVGLRGKETNVRLWKMIRNTWKKHRITIGIREFVYCSPNADDPINFSDIPDWNIALHIVNEVTSKKCSQRRGTMGLAAEGTISLRRDP